EGYHQSAVGHLSPFIHECRTYYLNSRCAVKIERIEGQAEAEVYVQTEYSALKAKLRSAAKG
uniref:hypothetical protein n=1 Tax=Aeromonas veronii TaxID=654 RepID=UPI003D25B7E9